MLTIQADLSKEDSADSAVRQTAKSLEVLVLVNAAEYFSGTVETTSLEGGTRCSTSICALPSYLCKKRCLR